MDSQLSGIWCYFIRRTYFDNSGLRSRLQSCKISSESDQQSKSTAIAETMEAIRQQKSACNFLFSYAVYLACYVPYLPSVILYSVYRSEISLFVPKWASIFLIFLNCSLNSYVLVHFDHLNVTFTINVDFYPPTPRPKYNYDFKRLISLTSRKLWNIFPRVFYCLMLTQTYLYPTGKTSSGRPSMSLYLRRKLAINSHSPPPSPTSLSPLKFLNLNNLS